MQKSLQDTNEILKAVELLRERGLAQLLKAGRIAAEGIVDSYIHGDGRIEFWLKLTVKQTLLQN